MKLRLNKVKLNLRKKALEIGGEEFPNVVKYLPQKGGPATIPKTTPGTMVKQDVLNAENSIYYFMKDHLQDYGISSTTPDNVNTIQGPEKIELNPESPIIQKLFYDGWFDYLNLLAPDYIKENPDIQEQLLGHLVRFFKFVQQ